MSNDRSVGPSYWYLRIGVVVILTGFGLFLYTLLHGIFHVTDNLVQIVVPGERDLMLKPKLTYTIFLETESVVDGRIYSTKSVSGLNCFVTSQTSGRSIHTYRSLASTTYSIGGREGSSVLAFVTEEPGAYRVSCDYGAGIQGPQVVVAVGSDVGQRIFSLVAKSLASIFGGFMLGGALILTFVVLRVRARRHAVGSSPAPIS